jgi:hypothetical protein
MTVSLAGETHMALLDQSFDLLRKALGRACQAQHIRNILAGRQQVLALPRAWVLECIERVAAEVLDLNDDWDYLRLLELAELLDAALVQRIVTLGLTSSNPEVREWAEDFQNRLPR